MSARIRPGVSLTCSCQPRPLSVVRSIPCGRNIEKTLAALTHIGVPLPWSVTSMNLGMLFFPFHFLKRLICEARLNESADFLGDPCQAWIMVDQSRTFLNRLRPDGGALSYHIL